MDKKISLTFFTSLVIVALLSSIIFYNLGMGYGRLDGYEDGYLDSIKMVAEKYDLDYEWQDLGNGLYHVKVWSPNIEASVSAIKSVQVDSYVELWRGGELISSERHAGTLTNIGKDFLEDQISDSPNATAICKYISVDDTDASGLSAASTKLTSELAASGLTRAVGTYASTGVGAWTVVKAFSVTGTVVAQTYGLQWDLASASDNNLLCYDTSAVKNCVSGDTLTVTWTISIS